MSSSAGRYLAMLHVLKMGGQSCPLEKNLFAEASGQRELAAIEGSTLPYHSLLVETGGAVQRYREIVLFHGERIYPEFLVAYQRV